MLFLPIWLFHDVCPRWLLLAFVTLVQFGVIWCKPLCWTCYSYSIPQMKLYQFVEICDDIHCRDWGCFWLLLDKHWQCCLVVLSVLLYNTPMRCNPHWYLSAHVCNCLYQYQCLYDFWSSFWSYTQKGCKLSITSCVHNIVSIYFNVLVLHVWLSKMGMLYGQHIIIMVWIVKIQLMIRKIPMKNMNKLINDYKKVSTVTINYPLQRQFNPITICSLPIYFEYFIIVLW